MVIITRRSRPTQQGTARRLDSSCPSGESCSWPHVTSRPGRAAKSSSTRRSRSCARGRERLVASRSSAHRLVSTKTRTEMSRRSSVKPIPTVKLTKGKSAQISKAIFRKADSSGVDRSSCRNRFWFAIEEITHAEKTQCHSTKNQRYECVVVRQIQNAHCGKHESK